MHGFLAVCYKLLHILTVLKYRKKYLFEEISKDKIHPRSGHESPEGEQRYSFYSSFNLSTMPLLLYPRKGTQYPL